MSTLMPYYLYFKTLHLLTLLGWTIGLLYLPRLFAYHADTEPGSETDTTFQTMERTLSRLLITPCMIGVFLTGILLLIAISAKVGGWFHAKFLLVLILAGFHGFLSRHRKYFARGENTRPASYFRTLGNSTTALVILIILLAVLKPF